MCLPVDDHMVHRGHAVFDTANVDAAGASVYGLDQHLDRFLGSAKQARIPAGDGHRFDKATLRAIILRTVGVAFAE